MSDRLRRLIALAADGSTTPEERLAAARTALAILDSPGGDPTARITGPAFDPLIEVAITRAGRAAREAVAPYVDRFGPELAPLVDALAGKLRGPR